MPGEPVDQFMKSVRTGNMRIPTGAPSSAAKATAKPAGPAVRPAAEPVAVLRAAEAVVPKPAPAVAAAPVSSLEAQMVRKYGPKAALGAVPLSGGYALGEYDLPKAAGVLSEVARAPVKLVSGALKGAAGLAGKHPKVTGTTALVGGLGSYGALEGTSAQHRGAVRKGPLYSRIVRQGAHEVETALEHGFDPYVSELPQRLQSEFKQTLRNLRA